MMRIIPGLATALASLSLLASCNGDGSQTTAGETGADTTGGADSTSDTITTTIDDTTLDTSASVTDATTTDPSTSITTADTSSSEGACSGECTVDDDCGPGQTCLSCLCIGDIVGCEVWGEGEFANCVTPDGVDASVCGGTDAFCLTAGAGIGSCSFTCEEVCDCPAPPAGFEAQVICSDVTGDMMNDCQIDCSGGEACPDGMTCFQDQVCLFGDATAIPPYGDCVNLDGMCEDSTCVTDAETTIGWCAGACTDDGDCAAMPSGTAPPVCFDISGAGDLACALDCGAGDCPDGMTCLDGANICVWTAMVEPPPPVPPYGDCANNPDETCLAEETCFEDASGAVCSEAGCGDATDCGAAPATGTATVACTDLGAGNTCVLDCSGGLVCPDGMECVDDTHCHWAGNGLLLDEDFEEGTFVPGWTVNDVDGNTPADQVSYVTDAFVVTDQLEAGTNFAAYSTSYYTPADASDDWLITPQFTPSATSSLSWEAWAPDGDFPDGYEVRVSTMTTAPADFLLAAPLLTVAAELQVYTGHMVDLSAFAGMPIFIAWRNTSNDQFLLLVDNVQVTE